MTDDERKAKRIREGWVTNYPDPKFTGDKLACLLSIERAQKDISFLLDRYDADQKEIDRYKKALREIRDVHSGPGLKCKDLTMVARERRSIAMIALGEGESEVEDMLPCCGCDQNFSRSTMQRVSGDYMCEECLDAAL